jgi:outer membrane protein assembly factor BamB
VYYILVQALDSHTGALLWSHTLTGEPSTPDIAGGYVILLDDDGLTALRTSDGSIAWTFQPGGSYGPLYDGGPPNDGISVQEGTPGPVIVNHLVLVDANVFNGDSPSQGAKWFAVNISTGKLVWRSSLDASVVVYTRPELNQSGDVLCVTGSKLQAPSVVQGLSLASGKTLWSHTIDFELSICGVSGNTFYLSERNVTGSLGGLRAFDSHSGTQLWQTATARPGGSTDASAPPQEDGLAVMPSEGPSTSGQYFVTGPVVVIQLNTGKVLWIQDLPVDVLQPILVVDNLVLVPLAAVAATNFRAQLVAYSLQAGTRSWTLPL